MKDVAKHAAVSMATVSRVLNNDPTVAEDLRKRVLESIETLGYEPNRAARRLRASSSDVIGLVISDIKNPFFLSMVDGIEQVASERRLSVLLCNTGEDPERQNKMLNLMRAEQVAGIILAPTSQTPPESLQALKKAGLPVVLIDRWIPGFEADTVLVDNFRGAYTAVRHLIALGHRRIAMITGDLAIPTSLERHRGYQIALTEAGLPLDSALVKEGHSQQHSAQWVTQELMESATPPDALFVANNLMTLGALKVLRELKIRVPEQVALVSFDDMPWSGDLYSPLTAISQPTEEMGREAMYLLLRRLAEPQSSFRTVVLPTQLIVRASCGAALREEHP